MRRVAAFALFVAIGASLAIPAAHAAGAKEVDRLRSREADAEVFLERSAGPMMIDQVRRTLLAAPGVRAIAFVDQYDAYEEFKRIFRDKPKLVKSVSPRDLPTSFRVDTRSHAAADDLVEVAAELAGVDEAVTTYPWSMAKMVVAIADCRVRGDSSLEIFMELDATPAELQAVQHLVEEEPGLEIVKVLSQEDAYADFVEIFASQPDRVEGMRAHDLPMSIRVRSDAMPSEVAIERLEGAPGVEQVGTNNGMCEDVFRLLARGLTDEEVARKVIKLRWGVR